VVRWFLTARLQRVFRLIKRSAVEWLRLKAQPTINALLFYERRKLF
jgi:hypothetical protein